MRVFDPKLECALCIMSHIMFPSMWEPPAEEARGFHNATRPRFADDLDNNDNVNSSEVSAPASCGGQGADSNNSSCSADGEEDKDEDPEVKLQASMFCLFGSTNACARSDFDETVATTQTDTNRGWCFRRLWNDSYSCLGESRLPSVDTLDTRPNPLEGGDATANFQYEQLTDFMQVKPGKWYLLSQKLPHINGRRMRRSHHLHSGYERWQFVEDPRLQKRTDLWFALFEAAAAIVCACGILKICDFMVVHELTPPQEEVYFWQPTLVRSAIKIER